MGVRQGPADLGADDARRLLAEACREIREARIAAGLSQAAVARAAGLSRAAYGRFERGEMARPPMETVTRSARAVGLRASLRLYPAGSPARDAGQLRLERDLQAVLGTPLRFRAEAALPIPGDLRSWDGLITDGSTSGFVDGEMRLADIQTLLRRLEAKRRDDPRPGVLLLVVRDSVHNRRVLRDHREVLRALLPLDSAAILRELRGGRVPPAGGLLVLRRDAAPACPLSEPNPPRQRRAAR
jgi:transcriptional regulator with XRE-family HTH domain